MYYKDEPLGIGNLQTRVAFPNAWVSTWKEKPLLVTKVGAYQRVLIYGFDCNVSDDRLSVTVTKGALIKDRIIIEVGEDCVLPRVDADGTFYIALRYTFKQPVAIRIVTPDAYINEYPLYMYLATIVLADNLIQSVVRDPALEEKPGVWPYYLAGASSEALLSLLRTPNSGADVHWDNLISVPDLVDAVELQTPGAVQVHWDNITNVPDLATHTQLQTSGQAQVHWDNITNVPEGLPPAPHTHDDRYYTETELQTSGQAQVHWNNITSKPTSFPPSTHEHDDRYYTETELQTSGQAQVHWNNITSKPTSFPPSMIQPQGHDSELNADMLDGQHSTYYLSRANHTGTQPPSTISPQGAGSGLDSDMLDGQHGTYYLARANHTGTQPPSTISPQGHDSGLNADMLDGKHLSEIVSAESFAGEYISTLINGSFERSSNGTEPDFWTVHLYSGGEGGRSVTAAESHGRYSVYFRQTPDGGGGYLRSGLIPVSDLHKYVVGCKLLVNRSGTNMPIKIRLRYYNADSVFLSSETLLSLNSNDMPSDTWFYVAKSFVPPAYTRFVRILLVGGDPTTSVSDTTAVYFDDVFLERYTPRVEWASETIPINGGIPNWTDVGSPIRLYNVPFGAELKFVVRTRAYPGPEGHTWSFDLRWRIGSSYSSPLSVVSEDPGPHTFTITPSLTSGVGATPFVDLQAQAKTTHWGHVGDVYIEGGSIAIIV